MLLINWEALTFLVKDLDTLSLVCCVCKSTTDPCEWFSTLKEEIQQKVNQVIYEELQLDMYFPNFKFLAC